MSLETNKYKCTIENKFLNSFTEQNLGVLVNACCFVFYKQNDSGVISYYGKHHSLSESDIFNAIKTNNFTEVYKPNLTLANNILKIKCNIDVSENSLKDLYNGIILFSTNYLISQDELSDEDYFKICTQEFKEGLDTNSLSDEIILTTELDLNLESKEYELEVEYNDIIQPHLARSVDNVSTTTLDEDFCIKEASLRIESNSGNHFLMSNGNHNTTIMDITNNNSFRILGNCNLDLFGNNNNLYSGVSNICNFYGNNNYVGNTNNVSIFNSNNNNIHDGTHNTSLINSNNIGAARGSQCNTYIDSNDNSIDGSYIVSINANSATLFGKYNTIINSSGTKIAGANNVAINNTDGSLQGSNIITIGQGLSSECSDVILLGKYNETEDNENTLLAIGNGTQNNPYTPFKFNKDASISLFSEDGTYSANISVQGISFKNNVDKGYINFTNLIKNDNLATIVKNYENYSLNCIYTEIGNEDLVEGTTSYIYIMDNYFTKSKKNSLITLINSTDKPKINVFFQDFDATEPDLNKQLDITYSKQFIVNEGKFFLID